MLWMEIRLDAAADAVDWVCTHLATTAYADNIHITPYVATESDSPWTTPAAHWTSTLYLHLPCDGHEDTHLATIESALASLHHAGLASAIEHRIVTTPAITLRPISHRIGRRFAITSAEEFESPETPTDILLKLKPSRAFGSGQHPATQLALQLIEQYTLPGTNVLDLGSGSGILSIAMAKLGAQVLALDNDPLAVRASEDAATRNNVARQVTVMAGSLGQGNHLGHWMGGATDQNTPLISLPTPFDLIVANVQARFQIALAADFRAALLPAAPIGGLLITSGFTADYAPGVVTALAAEGFEPIAEVRNHDWVALAHRLKA